MEAWEISFKIRYNYPFIEMSGKYPGTKISMWCVWSKEMVHVPLKHEDLMEELQEYVESIGRKVEGYKNTNDGLVLTMTCTCGLLQSMWDVIGKHNGVELHPAVYLDGWGYFKFISFSENDTKSFFSELSKIGESELLSKRLIHIDSVPSIVWVESFFSGLTTKQMEALVKAFDYGYYTSPREVTTDSIATSLGISRSTYEEHLRKAENRLMEAMVPYLKLFKAGGKKRSEMITPEIQLV